MPKDRRPKPWLETSRQGQSRYAWRFQGKRYWTPFYEDPEEARADATTQITEQINGTWRDKAGSQMHLEEWIDIWTGLRDVEPTSMNRDKYFAEAHILPEFQERELGSLTFEEIEEWEKAIQTRISVRGTPFADTTARGARNLLSTILADAVHAHKIKWNPAERRKGRRGKKIQAKGRRGPAHAAAKKSNVITPVQAICFAERCALLTGDDIDFVMNIFAPWTGVRWGELMAVEGWIGKESPLQLPDSEIATYALDWQLREIGGKVEKAPPKDGSYRTLDIPPFLADLLRWAVKNQRPACACPASDGRPACKGEDETRAHYLFLGPRGGHPRRSNYADRIITPAAEGLHPKREGARRPVYVTAEPWPGIPIRKGNRKNKAADMAEGTWPNLLGKFKPHDDRHTHSTWLDVSSVPKVLQMDRRGHAMSGMDAVYVHPTPEMRQQLCDYLQQLWQQAVAERYKLAPRSAVPLLDEILIGHEKSLKPEREQADATRTPEILTRTRRQQAHQAGRGRSRG
jgi:integrase